jgi:hypothetical protein
MDSSKTRVSDILGNHSDIIADIEEISRNLIFDIHYFAFAPVNQLDEVVSQSMIL